MCIQFKWAKNFQELFLTLLKNHIDITIITQAFAQALIKSDGTENPPAHLLTFRSATVQAFQDLLKAIITTAKTKQNTLLAKLAFNLIQSIIDCSTLPRKFRKDFYDATNPLVKEHLDPLLIPSLTQDLKNLDNIRGHSLTPPKESEEDSKNDPS